MLSIQKIVEQSSHLRSENDYSEQRFESFASSLQTDLSPLAVAVRDSNHVIGWCGLLTEETVPEMHIVLLSDHRRMGYGTEIAQALLGYAFNTLSASKVQAIFDPENSGAAKLLGRFDFKKVGVVDDETDNHFGFQIYELRTRISLTDLPAKA